MSKTLAVWMISERGELLQRVLLTRLLKSTTDRWSQKLDRIRFVLEGQFGNAF